MLTIPLQYFLNDKNIFHLNFTCSLTFQWKLLVTCMAKHGELFESKSLVYVQPLITRLCPLHVHKHGFIVHNRFITINCWSAVHYDIIVTTNFAATIYRLLCEISLQGSLARTISRRDIAKIVPISRWFIVLTFGNPCDVSLIYRRKIARTKRDIHRLSFALLLHSTVHVNGG